MFKNGDRVHKIIPIAQESDGHALLAPVHDSGRSQRLTADLQTVDAVAVMEKGLNKAV